MKIKYLSIFCLTLASLTLAAQEEKKFYKWVDKNGNVHYSDEPHKGAEELKVEPVPTVKLKNPKFTAISPSASNNNNSSDKNTQELYKSLTLISPEKGGVIRNNGGFITLNAQIDPKLFDGHKIQFLLDGLPVSNPTSSLELELEAVDFGEHNAGFIILDVNGEQVQSSQVHNFHLLNFINPKKRNN